MTLRSIRVSHILLTTRDLAQMIHDTLKETESQPELRDKMFKKLALKYSAWRGRGTV
ncbi:MAG: hypothetical protein ACE5ER_01235 [Nitrospinaceae bacterium]